LNSIKTWRITCAISGLSVAAIGRIISKNKLV
jgi:hypothetical protein